MTDYYRDLVPPTVTLPTPDPYQRGRTRLWAGDNLYSATKNFRLSLQPDGNLVLLGIDDSDLPHDINAGNYRTVVWATNTNGTGVERCDMQDDGNLVLYAAGGAAHWATNTNDNRGAYLRCQDDGNLILFSAGGIPIWASNTAAGSRPGGILSGISLP